MFRNIAGIYRQSGKALFVYFAATTAMLLAFTMLFSLVFGMPVRIFACISALATIAMAMLYLYLVRWTAPYWFHYPTELTVRRILAYLAVLAILLSALVF